MRRSNQQNWENQQDQQGFENAHPLHDLNHGHNSRRGNYPIDSHFNTYDGAYGNEDYDNQGGFNSGTDHRYTNPQGYYRPGGATYSGPDYYNESQNQRPNYRSEYQQQYDWQDRIHDRSHNPERSTSNRYQEDYESRNRYNRPQNRYTEEEWQRNRQMPQNDRRQWQPDNEYTRPDERRNQDDDRSHYNEPSFYKYR